MTPWGYQNRIKNDETVGDKILRNCSKNATSSITLSSINRLSSFIADEFQPEKIILFGSHAYGNPNAQSDVDLLVIMPFQGSPFRQAGIVLNQVVKSIGVMPLDLSVRTPEQVNDRLSIGDSFIQEIIQRGRVLYEANHA